jgi:hypothetical protein
MGFRDQQPRVTNQKKDSEQKYDWAPPVICSAAMTGVIMWQLKLYENTRLLRKLREPWIVLKKEKEF